MGKILYPRGYAKSKNQALYSNPAACKTCERKEICGKYDKGLRVQMPESSFSREYNDKEIHIKQVYFSSDKKLLRKRKAIVEHPFGSVKRHQDAAYCLLKGKGNVGGEFALSFLVYNLKRVINIMGTRKMIEAMSL